MIATSWLNNCYLPHVSSHGESDEGAFWGSLLRTLIPFMRAPPSGPNYLLKAASLNTMPWGTKIPIQILWGALRFSPFQGPLPRLPGCCLNTAPCSYRTEVPASVLAVSLGLISDPRTCPNSCHMTLSQHGCSLLQGSRRTSCSCLLRWSLT